MLYQMSDNWLGNEWLGKILHVYFIHMTMYMAWVQEVNWQLLISWCRHLFAWQAENIDIKLIILVLVAWCKRQTEHPHAI